MSSLITRIVLIKLLAPFAMIGALLLVIYLPFERLDVKVSFIPAIGGFFFTLLWHVSSLTTLRKFAMRLGLAFLVAIAAFGVSVVLL